MNVSIVNRSKKLGEPVLNVCGNVTRLHYVYLGDDAVFSKKVGEAVENYSNFKNIEDFEELKNYFDANEASNVVIISEFKLKNGVSGLKLFRDLHKNKRDQCLFILLADQRTSQNQILMAHDIGVKDVFMKSQSIASLLVRIDFHLYNIQAVTGKRKTAIKSEVSPLKRCFDIVVAGAALIILSPILLIVALLIKLDSPGPIFYVSKRVGTDCKVFDFYKFRSMKMDAGKEIDKMSEANQYGDQKENPEMIQHDCPRCKEKGEFCSPVLIVGEQKICENFYLFKKSRKKMSFMKFKNDPRITRLGYFLRKSSIDELPQLINVLKGDMSIVGNRPLPIYEAEQLTNDRWILRFLAPAGITGLWQVSKRGKSKMSEDERKELDNTYAKTHSFLGDIKIILKTIPALFQSENV